MPKRRKRLNLKQYSWLPVLGLVALIFIIVLLLRGADVSLLNPKGYIAESQKKLIIFTVSVMLSVAIPTLLLFYFIAWKYRETNNHSTYDSTTRHGKWFTLGLWAIPSLIVLVLASAMWPVAHRLDPHKAIAADNNTLNIQVIALRWKWLFIYPEQNIASVNFVQLPVNTPVQFNLSADEAPMSSFWIPHLGGQLYAMTGHDNRLNLMADAVGDYAGRSAEINGDGFAEMTFKTRASTTADFDAWIKSVKQSAAVLDPVEYSLLLKPSTNNPVKFYSAAQTNLFTTVIHKYSGSHEHQVDYQ